MGLTRIRAEQISDIDYKQAVRVITVANVMLSGGAPATVDGVNLVADDRVLVAGQNTGSQNGLYYVQTVGAGDNGTWVRTTDGNADGEIEAGMIVMVTEGTVYKDTQWKLTTNNPIVIGQTALTFEQNSAFAFGNIYANGTAVLATTVGDAVTFTAGNNIAITGNNTSKTVTIGVTGISLNSISNGTSNVNVVSSGGNVTVGIDGTNNVAVFGQSSTTFAGNVLPSANITYDLGSTSQRWRDIWLSNSTIYLGNAQISANSTSLIFTNPEGAQTVFSGTTANVSAGTVTATGNITGGNLITSGIISATGNANVGNLGATNANLSAMTVSGNANVGNLGATNANITAITATGNANVGNLGTAGLVVATGNITGGNLITAGQISATGNITGGNLKTSAVTIGSAGAVSGVTTISASGNANVGNLGAATVVATTLTGTLSTAAQPNITSVGTLTSLSVTGNISGGNVSGTLIAGTLTTAAQPNVTSVGTLTSLSATGNVTGGNLITAGLTSTATLSASGNANVGNLGTAGLIAATGNITGGNLVTAGLVSAGTTITATGNVSGGNITTAGQVTATGNITGGNLNTGAQVIATGNVTGGNITTAGRVDATGNITGGNLSGTLISGTLTTAAQPNVTSLGTLTSLTTSGNAIIGGDLTVNGNTIYVNITDLNVQDPIIGLGRGENNAPLTSDDGKDRGEQLWYYTSAEKSAFIGYDNSADKLIAALDVSITNEIVTVNSYGNFVIGGLEAATGAFTGNVSTGNISGTTGTFTNVGGTLSTAAQPNITSVGTLTSLSVTGNVSAGNVSGTLIAGTLTTAAQPNVTSVGTLTSLLVTGNVTGGNLTTAGQVTATGNITGGNLKTSAVTIGSAGAVSGVTTLSASGNANVGNLGAAAGVFTGAVSSSTTITATGNVTGGNLITTGLTSTATLSASGNANVGNLGTAGLIVATGNVTGGNLNTGAQVTATGNITGGNIVTGGQVVATGNVSGGNLSGTSITGTLTTAAQTNITSVGTLTGLNVTASNISALITDSYATASSTRNFRIKSGVRELGLAANLGSGSYNSLVSSGDLGIIATGSAQGNANLVLSPWASATSGIKISSVSNVATITIAATTIDNSGTVYASGNIQGANIVSNAAITGTTVTATGNITGGNILGNGAGLSGINVFSNVTVQSGNSILADSISDTLTLVAGDGIAITADSSTDTLTFAVTGGSEIFVDGADFGTVTEAVTLSDDLGTVDAAVDQEADLGTIVTAGIFYPDQLVLPSKTVAELANISASPAGQFVFCSNESGGSIPAFSDGTNWRRVTDRAIVT